MRFAGDADTSSVLAAAGVTVIGLLVPEIVVEASLAVIDCVPALSSVAVTVATPPVNDTALKLAPPRLSESEIDSLKPVTTLLYLSSAVIVTLVVLPAERLLGEAETSSLLAAAGVTVIGLLVPETSVDGWVLVNSVQAVHVRRIAGRDGLRAGRIERGRDRGHAVGERNAAEARAAQTVGKRNRIAEAGNDVVVLVLGRDGDAGRAAGGKRAGRSRHQQLAGRRRRDRDRAAGAGERGRRVAGGDRLRAGRVERGRDGGLPLVNEMAEKLAPPKPSDSVTESLKLVTTLFEESSAVIVTLVVLPAERLPGEADTSNWLAGCPVTVTELLVPESVADESVAVMVCVPIVSSVAVTVATPLVNETAEKLAPPKLSESVTESLKPGITTPCAIFRRDRDAGRAAGREAAGRSRDQQLAGRCRPDRDGTAGTGNRDRRIFGRNRLRSDCVQGGRDRGLSAAERRGQKVAPPKLSESVTGPLKPVMALLYWSSAVIVTLVVLPARRLLGEADTWNLLAPPA